MGKYVYAKDNDGHEHRIYCGNCFDESDGYMAVKTALTNLPYIYGFDSKRKNLQLVSAQTLFGQRGSNFAGVVFPYFVNALKKYVNDYRLQQVVPFSVNDVEGETFVAIKKVA